MAFIIIIKKTFIVHCQIKKDHVCALFLNRKFKHSVKNDLIFCKKKKSISDKKITEIIIYDS